MSRGELIRLIRERAGDAFDFDKANHYANQFFNCNGGAVLPPKAFEALERVAVESVVERLRKEYLGPAHGGGE